MMQKRNTKKYEMDMCSGSILKKMIVFAVPLMCSGILQLLFNAADVIVVGRFAGDNSLAAVGATTSLIHLLTNLFIGLSVGGNVLVARYYGAKKEQDLTETIHTAIALSLVSGIFLTIIGIVGAPKVLSLMSTPPEVFDKSVLYLRIYFAGMTATMVYNFGSAIMRAVGDTKRPLYFLTAAGIINVCLNLIFVIRFKMDVAGVGLATVISQIVSAVLIVKCLMENEGFLKLNLKLIRFTGNKLSQIVKIGLPAGLQGTLFSLSNVVIQSSINSFGAIVVAGSAAAANVEGFGYVAMNAFHQAAISFTSQNVGAKRYERVNRILIRAMGCAAVVGIVFAGLMLAGGRQVLGLYTSSSEVIDAGMVRIYMVPTTYFIAGMMDVLVGSLRGLGYSVVPMIVSLLGICGIRILWIWTIFPLESFHNPYMIYITYPLTWVITTTAHFISFVIIRRKLAGKWGV